ncbi:MAG: hypothetical protein RM338_24425 [Nostoc sp. DedQUE12a]|nr:hypothetical protein [Nostoc sp. DedQUE12a]
MAIACASCVRFFRYARGYPFDAVEPDIGNQMYALNNPLQPILTRAINWDLIRQQYVRYIYANYLNIGKIF